MEKDHLKQLLNLKKDNPNDPFIHFAIAQEYLKKGDQKEALNYLKGLRKNYPNYTGTYYHLGKLYEELGESKKAIETYRKGMAITQSLGQTHDYEELESALQLITDDSDE